MTEFGAITKDSETAVQHSEMLEKDDAPTPITVTDQMQTYIRKKVKRCYPTRDRLADNISSLIDAFFQLFAYSIFFHSSTEATSAMPKLQVLKRIWGLPTLRYDELHDQGSWILS
jgi:hypothetical protein